MSSLAQGQMPFVHPLKATEAAYAGLSAIQTYSPGEQAMAVAILARAFLGGLGIDVSQALNQAERVLTDADTYHSPAAGALQSYIRGELK